MKQARAHKAALQSYTSADKYFVFNDNDVDVTPVKVYLPKPPERKYIDGYGLLAKNQYFAPDKEPPLLGKLKAQVFRELEIKKIARKSDKISDQKIIDGIWDKLNENKRKYAEEIEWIKKQIYHNEYGYWCYINGKPVYVDGWHYRYCTSWDMGDVSTPEYRDRDRRFYHAARHFATTTMSFKNLDEDGNAIPDKDGNYEMVDMFFRTFFGFMYPKHRRDGATHKCLCILYDIVTSLLKVLGGIQSFDEDNAGEHFKEKLVPSWKEMPFFLRPIWSGTSSPAKSLNMLNPASRFKPELGSKVTFATTANRKFYDGKKQYIHLCEEAGKTLLEKINPRWDVVKETLSQGGGSSIHGIAMFPSTVADMKEGGGEDYYILSEASNYYKRNSATGQTVSGIGRIFFPAWDGLENFIGPYGESVIDTPTEEQAKHIRRKIGSKEFIESRSAMLLKDGSMESMRKYRSWIELYPCCYADCFRITSGDTGFNIEKINQALYRLRRDGKDPEKGTISGNYKWVIPGQSQPLSSAEYISMGFMKNNVEGEVRWFPEKNGRWKVSKVLLAFQSNRKILMDGYYQPEFPERYTGSGDPYQFLDKATAEKRGDKSRQSYGGLAVFWERDYNIDPLDVELDKLISHRFVCTYEHRPDDDDEFAEDCLMTMIYWGGLFYPETNVDTLYKHLHKRNHQGFLKHDVDEATNKIKDKPGFTSNAITKQAIFNSWKTYIEHHFHRERHIDLVKQVKKIKGIEYMTDHDLFTAGGGCLISQRSGYAQVLNQTKDVVELDEFIEIFDVD